MKTSDFNSPITSLNLLENIEKQFGSRVNINKYTREELEDMRNKIRTRIFQHEGSSKYNDLLTNETYQKDKAMLQLLNTRIKEMLGEAKKGVRDIRHPKRAKGTKPDFLDMDKDGNKKEPMKKAIKDKKVMEDLQADDGKPYKNADAFFSQFEPDWFDDEKVSPDGMEIRGYIDGVNVMVWRYSSPRKTSGWGKYDDSGLEQGVAESPESNKAAAKKVPSAADRAKSRDQQRSTPAKKARSAAQSKGITQDKDGTYYAKESKMKEEVKKSQIPAAQRKAKGGDWKVNQADLDKEASSSASSSAGLAKRKADLKSQGVMETDKPSAGMTKKEKSTVVKKAQAGKDIGKPGKGFEKVEKAAKKSGAKDPKAVAAAAMWKKQAKESFRRNVKMVNEGLAYYIMEDEEGKAKAITSASDIVNDFTSWMQRVGQYQTKAIIELADAIRADFGVQQSEQFKQSVAPALAATLETLTQQREAISNAVAVLAGEDMPQDQMGMEPEVGPETPDMEPSEPDMMNEPGDEFGASDAAAGPGLTGRELRESKFAKKLAESHSIISKLAK